MFEKAKAFVNRMAKTFTCPRCGGPLTAGGNCANLCGGA